MLHANLSVGICALQSSKQEIQGQFSHLLQKAAEKHKKVTQTLRTNVCVSISSTEFQSASCDECLGLGRSANNSLLINQAVSRVALSGDADHDCM